MHQPVHPFTHQLANLFAQSPTHPPTHLPTYPPTRQLTYSFAISPTHSPTHLLNYKLTHQLAKSLTRQLNLTIVPILLRSYVIRMQDTIFCERQLYYSLYS
jgi:hypothetical protein